MRHAIIAGSLLAPATALAHPGHGLAADGTAPLLHVLTTPEHALLLVGVPLLVAGAVALARRIAAGGDDV
jgi:hypothetical protein